MGFPILLVGSSGYRRTLRALRRTASFTARGMATSPLHVQRRDDGIYVFKIDVTEEKMNVLNESVMSAFDTALAELEKLPPAEKAKAVVVLSGKPESFIAGADIKMLDACTSAGQLAELSARGQRLMDRLSALGVPVVAGINGVALGGGLELALSCTYRVGTRTTKVGLPEVKLGLLPGAGGTQRLPRLVGIQEAIGMMTTGKTLKADKALKAGILDELVEPAALEATAVRAAQELAAGKLKGKGSGGGKSKGLMHWMLEKNPVGRAVLWSQAAKAIAKGAGTHYPAPYAILDVVKAGVNGGMGAGLKQEAQEFGRLGMTPVSKALRGIFFAETATKKGPFGKVAQGSEVKTLGVLGAGLMGAGIALIGADPASCTVIMKDRDHAALRRGEKQIEDALAARVKKRQISKPEADAIAGRVMGVTDADDDGAAWKRLMRGADLVIEAVPEELHIKHKVLQQMQELLGPKAVLATNTSAIPIADIARGGRPDMVPRVVGMHFFSPADRMPLCEVIPHEGTAPEAAALAVATAQRMGKTVIAVKDVPGFFVNRSLAPMLAEMVALVQAGVPPEAIDSAMKSFGMPVGPCTLADEVGLDTSYHVLETMIKALGDRMLGPNNEGIKAAVAAGYTGRKGGRGFYVYPTQTGKGGKESKGPRPINTDMITLQTTKYAPTVPGYDAATVERLKKDPKLLVDRLILRFIKECIHGLQDSVIRSAGDGDIGAVFGLGFPPYLGGPFRYVDQRGPAEVLKTMQGLAETVGPQYAPPQLLKDKAAAGRGFHEA